MVKLGKTSEVDVEEILRKNAEEMKKLSDKVDSYANGKKKMEDLLSEVEKKKVEKEGGEKEKVDKEKSGHDHGKDGHHHVHILEFNENGTGRCTDGKCGLEFALSPVIKEDDWNKEMPDPMSDAELGFNEKKTHNVYECTTCGEKVIGPKRKNVGIENKLNDCPFCHNPNAKFQPVDLRKLKEKLRK